MSIDTPDVRKRLEGQFRLLAADTYEVTSRKTTRYNCIAWALGKTNKWWEAADYPGYKWLKGVPRDGSTKAAIALYERFGYRLCQNQSLEDGFEKVAIYYDDGGYTHAARQLPSGKWTSKLGPFEDICHESLECLCGDGRDGYGKVFCILKRPSESHRVQIRDRGAEFDDKRGSGAAPVRDVELEPPDEGGGVQARATDPPSAPPAG